MVTITKKLLESWGFPKRISEKLLSIEVEQLFDAPISTEDKVWVLLHEEILGKRGLVYVAARAARRACTEAGWSHPDSLRALDLCDRYASGEEIPEEEFRAASRAARAASWAEVYVVSKAAARSVFLSTPCNSLTAAIASNAASSVFKVTEVEREAQLKDCREWILRAT